MWRWAAEGAPDSSEEERVRAKRGIRVIIVKYNNEQHPRPERSDQTAVVHTTCRLLLPRCCVLCQKHGTTITITLTIIPDKKTIILQFTKSSATITQSRLVNNMAIYRRPTMPRSAKRFRKNVKARSPWTAKRSSNVLTSVRVPGIRRPDFGFPDRMVTKLRYVDNFNLTGSAGVVGANVFRFNSCFDPDLTGVGHQPMYFDQFCGAAGTGPYGRYRVISAKATVSFM